MKSKWIVKEDVLSVADSLKMDINEEIIDMALDAYDDYREQYPNDNWWQIIETMLYDYFNNLD